MHPRALLVLGIGALAAGAGWLAAQAARTARAAAHLALAIEAADGRPAPGARARLRPDGPWQVADATGRLVLALGPHDAAGAGGAALEERVQVQGPPPVRAPAGSLALEARGAGRWEGRARLAPVGLLRVFVAPSHLGEARAWIPPDPGGRIRPADEAWVARAGRPAAWHVGSPAGAPAEVAVHLEGDPHLVHGTQVATTVTLVPAPGPGGVREVRLEPEPRRPISGRVELPPGWGPEPVAGIVRVAQHLADGGRVGLGEVVLAADGRFEIPYAGPRRYDLVADLGWRGRSRPVTVEGGAEASLVLPTALVEVEVLLAPPPARAGLFEAWIPDGEGGGHAARIPFEADAEGLACLRLPAGATLRLRARVPHAATGPGLESDAVEFDPGDLSPPLVLPLRPQASGALEVTLADPQGPGRHGATVEVEGRPATTLLPALAPRLRLEHLPAGPVAVRIQYADESLAVEHAAPEVPADGVAGLTLAPGPGGWVEVHWAPTAAGRAPARIALRWEADGAPYGVPGRLWLAAAGDGRYAHPAPLRPGRYRVHLEWEGAPAGPARDLSIAAGQTRRLDLDPGAGGISAARADAGGRAPAPR